MPTPFHPASVSQSVCSFLTFSGCYALWCNMTYNLISYISFTPAFNSGFRILNTWITVYTKNFQLPIPITIKLELPFLYTNFSTPDPDHSILELSFHTVFNPRYFLNPKLCLKFRTTSPLPIQIHLKPHLPVISLLRKDLQKSFFPLQIRKKNPILRSMCRFSWLPSILHR
jgi:hypothetical protein